MVMDSGPLSRRRLRRAVSQIRYAQAHLVRVVPNQAGKLVDLEGWTTAQPARI
jgi:hypothetical protein